MAPIRVGTAANARETVPPPNLIEMQLDSFRWFLEHGLRELFDDFSPVEDFTQNLRLTFHDFYLGEPKYQIPECRQRDATFEAPLKVLARLTNLTTGEIKETEVYLGDLPLMTDNGTFIVNGAERAVVSQLSRSPGVYFKDTMDYSGRMLLGAQIIPNEGAWVEMESDANDVVWARIGQAHRFAATTLLRALNSINLGPDSRDMACAGDGDLIRLFGEAEKLDEVTVQSLTGRRPWDDIVHRRTGEVLAQAGQKIERETAAAIVDAGVKRLQVAVLHPLIDLTMDRDPTHNENDALLDIYRRERPGDPVTTDIARARLFGLFCDPRRYDLGRVGRYKMNRKLGLEMPQDVRGLTKEDVAGILRYLARLSEGDESATVDEIDHLMNKRVRCVGELLQNQFRIGMLRMERIARERMTSMDPEDITAQTVISTKPVAAAIRSFFGSSQLSQFMDQTNPLTELTHKRRVSALGPGGLSRQSAKLEVRDVHHSHYGRICPIETPEGPNIGLIGSLALYARLDDYGFIEAPYRRVKKGVVTEEVVYLSADEEEQYRIAPADAPMDARERLEGPAVAVRHGIAYPAVPVDEVDFIDLSPNQTVSLATSLIPFLENDEANRALMGSNMQRQAVPLVRAEQPYVATGIEEKVAQDSGALITARAAGRVEQVEATRIVVQRGDGERDEYALFNFMRSNAATCIHQRPIVRQGDFVRAGQALADGPSTSGGELALGRNVLVAFMPWEGFNYEDAILVSERLTREDVFTSIHIEKYEHEARETKVGPEEITRDIPNVGDEALRNLDEDGVVRIGAEVRAEDILVGKVAPKAQEELTAEEKLVRAIFGEKAAEMRDASLRVPHGEKGKVVSVRRFSRLRGECSNEKCKEEHQFSKEPIRQYCDKCGSEMRKVEGDELPAGVNQMVRVYVAQRRKVMEGDKMAGRHGNKGVIAKILPMEEMPHMADGTPVDVVLSPLGVPSRMNIGQVMETHLAWVAEQLGLRFHNPIFQGAREREILDRMGYAVDRLRSKWLCDYAESELGIERGWCKPEASYEEMTRALEAHLAADEDLLDAAVYRLAVDPAKTEAAGDARARAKLAVEELARRTEECVGFDPKTAKCPLYDGRTGDRFHQQVTVGSIYMMKLAHLVEDKIHARSTGPYSLVTQQPLGGKAQFGGQRFGEMEVWALEAYGAAHTLQEILTIKSDDVLGRVKTYECIVKGENIMEPGIPESFKILIKELQSLALQVTIESADDQPIRLDGEEEVGYR